MGNTSSSKKIDNLEIDIFDRFIVLTNNMAQITSFDPYMMTSNYIEECQAKIQKCKDDINTAKQTFASKQNIDTIDETYFVPIIYNLHSLHLTGSAARMKKYRKNCIKICREIATLLRKYLILTQNKKNVD